MAKIYGQLQLPNHFAEDLLNCEIQLDLNDKVPPQIIIKLIQLYTIAIQYYESIQSYKYLYFQKRMNKIVKSPDIIDSFNTTVNISLLQKKVLRSQQEEQKIYKELKKKKSHNPFKRQERQRQQLWDKIIEQQRKKQKQKRQKQQRQEQFRKLKQLQSKQKQGMIQDQIISTTASLSSSKQVKQMINLHDQKLNQVDKKIKSNINQQQIQLKLKLEQRLQRRKIKKSLSSIDFPVRQKDQMFQVSKNIESPQQMITCFDKNFSNIIHQIDSDQEQKQKESLIQKEQKQNENQGHSQKISNH